MNAVVFLIGETMGDALGASGRALRKSFEHLGFDFLEVNFANPDAIASLNRIIQERSIEFAYSFAGMCIDMNASTSEGKESNLWEVLRVPFITIHGDTPAYFFDRHVAPSSAFASLYAFEEHYEMRKRLPGARGLLGVVPPAVEDAVPKRDIDFGAKERGRLLFLKNGNDPGQLLDAWRECLSPAIFIMLTDLASELTSRLDSNLDNDIDAFVCAYFASKSWDIANLVKLRLFFIAQLDDYCRRVKSTMIVESLLEFPVEVHGFNWEHVDFSGKRATLVPNSDFNLSRSLIKDALGVIDMSPNTGKSPHDRPRRAFGSYTLCLTNEQQCLKDRCSRFMDFSFRFDAQSIGAKVADVLANPKRAIALGIEIAEEYRRGEEPHAVARYLQDTASILRLQCAPQFANLPNYFAWPPKKIE